MFSPDTPPAYYLLPGLLLLATPLLLRLRPASAPPAAAETMPSSGKTHTVVVLGAGFVGLPVVHHLLRHTPAAMGLRVVLVSPNDAFFWNVAVTRGIVPADRAGLSDEQLFFDMAPAFAAATQAGRFQHLLGRATRLDPDARTVEVCLNGDRGRQTVSYDTVVIATGSDMRDDMPFKTVAGGTAETRAALATLRARIAAASRVVVAGGGETGVEIAAELGHAYSSAPPQDANHKDILFVVADSLPLAGFDGKQSIRQSVAADLQRLGVRVLYNTRVVSARQQDGQTQLTLSKADNGTSSSSTSILMTDVYIPALGETANTAFLPSALLDSSTTGRNRVRTRDTLQAEGYDDIFVIGDVANLPSKGLKSAEEQLHVLAPQLQTHLQNCASGTTRPLRSFKPSQLVVLLLALGPDRGIGQVGPFPVFSFVASFLKSRTLGVERGPDYAAGRRTVRDTNW